MKHVKKHFLMFGDIHAPDTMEEVNKLRTQWTNMMIVSKFEDMLSKLGIKSARPTYIATIDSMGDYNEHDVKLSSK